MAKYVNPIPYIDKAKKFELRLALEFSEVMEVQQAKEAAEYLLGLDKETLARAFACTKQFAVYPDSEAEI